MGAVRRATERVTYASCWRVAVGALQPRLGGRPDNGLNVWADRRGMRVKENSADPKTERLTDMSVGSARDGHGDPALGSRGSVLSGGEPRLAATMGTAGITLTVI